MAAKERAEPLEIAGRTVAISNPGKIYFPTAGHTKLDVVRYYLAVGDADDDALAVGLAHVTGREHELQDKADVQRVAFSVR